MTISGFSHGLPLVLAIACIALTSCDSSNDPKGSFALAVIADPHIDGDPDHEDRLATVVDVLNSEIADRNIELVLVVGDIGWGDNLAAAKHLLDDLAVPYVPLVGDNEIHGGSEEAYETTFRPQYTVLAGLLNNWTKQSSPVWNPEAEQESWFQNFSFDYRGVHFIVVDWCARGLDGIEGEQGYLHDFDGGTWPWFQTELAGLEMTVPDSVVLVSHIPMHAPALTGEKLEAIETLLAPYAAYIYANLAGHLHMNYEVTETGSYDVYVTAATWSSYEPLRVVTVSPGDDGYTYHHELLYIPF